MRCCHCRTQFNTGSLREKPCSQKLLNIMNESKLNMMIIIWLFRKFMALRNPKYMRSTQENESCFSKTTDVMMSKTKEGGWWDHVGIVHTEICTCQNVIFPLGFVFVHQLECCFCLQNCQEFLLSLDGRLSKFLCTGNLHKFEMVTKAKELLQ